MNPSLEALWWCPVQVTVLAVAALCIDATVGRRRPAARALIAASALIAVVGVSVAAAFPCPGWSINWEGLFRHRPVTASEAAADQPVASADANVRSSNPTHDAFWDDSLLEKSAATHAVERSAESAKASLGSHWALLAVVSYLLGVSFMGLGIALGLVTVRNYRRDSLAIVDRGLADLVDVVRTQLGCRKQVELRESSRLNTPAMMGWRRPILLLPGDWRSWTDIERRAVLAHEIAHVRRRDFPSWVAAQVGVALHFYHPLVYVLAARLRLQQELAADAAAARLVGGQRQYVMTLAAMALRQPDAVVAWPARAFLPTSRTFLRRIEMLHRSQSLRSDVSRPFVFAGIAAVAVAAMCAAGFRGSAAAVVTDPKQQPKSASGPHKSPDASSAVLYGRVTTEAGDPLAEARVRVAIPATDMRFVDSTTHHNLREISTDANGNFWLTLPGITKPTRVSIDAMQPGFERLVGTLMRGGNAREVELTPGVAGEANLKLKPARYFSGTVVDEHGKPIPAVEIAANANTANASGGVERTASRSDGSFELFNYSLAPRNLRNVVTKGVVWFSHPDYIEDRIDDVYALSAKECENLRIVLKSGHLVAGRVLDAAGNPVPNAMLKLVAGRHRKATMSDMNGKFVLRGLDSGRATLTVHAFQIKQKAHLQFALDSDRADLKVPLQPMSLPADPKTYTVLGMKLTDVTPQLRSAYDLWFHRGALILDPGKDSERLNIGSLAEGDDFWMVGEKEVGSVRDFVKQLLAEAGHQAGDERNVRVVYSFSRVHGDGNNTQYIRLTKDDLKQLESVLDQPGP